MQARESGKGGGGELSLACKPIITNFFQLSKYFQIFLFFKLCTRFFSLQRPVVHCSSFRRGVTLHILCALIALQHTLWILLGFLGVLARLLHVPHGWRFRLSLSSRLVCCGMCLLLLREPFLTCIPLLRVAGCRVILPLVQLLSA